MAIILCIMSACNGRRVTFNLQLANGRCLNSFNGFEERRRVDRLVVTGLCNRRCREKQIVGGWIHPFFLARKVHYVTCLSGVCLIGSRRSDELYRGTGTTKGGINRIMFILN